MLSLNQQQTWGTIGVTPKPAFRFAITTGFETKREKELEDSERRAHAARISSRQKVRRRQSRYQAAFVIADPRHPDQHQVYVQPEVYVQSLPPKLFGHSDPFHSNGVQITPQMNLIMTFMRDTFYPAVYFNDWARSCSANAPKHFVINEPSAMVSSVVASRDWNKLVWSLHDEGLGLASLAACSAMAPELRQVTHVIALEMQTKSLHLLRNRLAREGDAFRKSRVGIMNIFWLFESEVLRGNQDTAQIHGIALRDTVVEAYESGVIELQMLLEFLWVDTNQANRFMRRTVFDMTWVLSKLVKIWAYIKMIVPMPKEETHLDVHHTVTDEILRPILVETRLQLLLTQTAFSADECKERGAGDLAFTWIGTRSLVDCGRLVNRFLDLEDGIGNDPKLSPGVRYTQASLILAMLLVHRCLHPVYINGTDIRDTSESTLKRMKVTMLLAISDCTAAERLHYAQAHLWSIYIAAVVERRIHAARKTSSPRLFASFDKMLVEQAILTNVLTWKQLQAIEYNFIQTEMIQPSGFFWFDDVLDKWIYSKVQVKKEADD